VLKVVALSDLSLLQGTAEPYRSIVANYLAVLSACGGMTARFGGGRQKEPSGVMRQVEAEQPTFRIGPLFRQGHAHWINDWPPFRENLEADGFLSACWVKTWSEPVRTAFS